MAMLMGNMSPQRKSFPTQQSMVGGSPYSPYAGGMQTQTTTFPSSSSMVTSGNMAPNTGGSFVLSPLLSPQAAGNNVSMSMSFVPPTGTQGSGIQVAGTGTLSPIGTLKSAGTVTAPGTLTAPSASPSRQPTGPINTHHLPPGGGGGDCRGAEAECTNEEECGGDVKAPTRTEYICGIDKKPLLPLGLVLSTSASGMCLVLLQVQLLRRYAGLEGSAHQALRWSSVALYGMAIFLMFYCMGVDPGQVKRRRGSKAGEENKPPRAHKTWLYDRPVRRFDHHCRWLLNSIALYNHREFIVMLVLLIITGVLSWLVDIWVVVTAFQDDLWSEIPLKLFAVVLHFVYAAGVLYLVIPILEIHTGLISRNELAREYNRDQYRVLRREGHEDVPANELDTEAYNEAVDDSKQFEYSAELNPYDKGMLVNCSNFWCTSRSEHEKGDF
eukprot:TRINITY_DN15238_c0_g3_i1.p1 TRINITY_DN15238_c0_g3~~TRINITY_DN15238_c0_g3_i1.p1  ORF type:complete len:440 (+),score=64.08 TRINITY_DN15238_c0_g3_i1:62-1381(+)